MTVPEMTHFGSESGGGLGGGAHACVLHVSLVEGFVPKQNDSDTEVPSMRKQVTERVRVPPPHEREHGPYEPVRYTYVYAMVVVVVAAVVVVVVVDDDGAHPPGHDPSIASL